MLELLGAATLTTLATGLGAIPVFLLGSRAAALQPGLLGLAAGVMTLASAVGLIAPALDDGSGAEVGAGLILGIGFFLAARAELGHARRARALSRQDRTAVLVFGVLLVHSLPEGFAIGTAYASETAGLGAFVVAAIALQNIPEGTSVAIPMAAAGHSPARQFWAAVATSSPQPLGAAIAYVLVEEISALLPVSFAFAAGAMLALVTAEILPEAVRGGAVSAAAGFCLGGGMMLALSLILGV